MLVKKKFKIILIITLLWFIGIWSVGIGKAEPFQTPESLTLQIDWLENDLRNSRNVQVDILSPKSFAEAEELLKEAKKRLDRGDKQSKIVEKIAGAQNQLKRAKEVSQRARKELSQVIKARELARAAGATNYEKEYAAVEEEFLELKNAAEINNIDEIQEELGDLLFSIVNISRFLKVNPEDALRNTINKFIKRFTIIEQEISKQGKKLEDVSLEEMDKIWEKSKNLPSS